MLARCLRNNEESPSGSGILLASLAERTASALLRSGSLVAGVWVADAAGRVEGWGLFSGEKSLPETRGRSDSRSGFRSVLNGDTVESFGVSGAEGGRRRVAVVGLGAVDSTGFVPANIRMRWRKASWSPMPAHESADQ